MNIFPIVVGILAAICFLLAIIFSFIITSPKHLEKRLTKYGGVAARAQNNIINNNEDILKETANKTADINKDAVKTIAHSVKEGFLDNSTVYCKHCGAEIDADSTFCKKCGKQL